MSRLQHDHNRSRDRNLPSRVEQGLARLNALSTKARRSEWNEYLDAIDCGSAGRTKISLILNSPYQQGLDPTEGLAMSEFGVVPTKAEAPA